MGVAIDYATRVINVNPNSTTYYMRGLLYLQLDRFEEAIADLERVLQLDPNSAFTYYALSNARYEIGDISTGREDFQQAEILNNNNNDRFDLYCQNQLGHYNLGIALLSFPIYARLRVPEIWCYDDGQLIIYTLQNENYLEVEKSLIFTNLPIQEIPNLIEQNRDKGRRAIRQAVRTWVRNIRSN